MSLTKLAVTRSGPLALQQETVFQYPEHKAKGTLLIQEPGPGWAGTSKQSQEPSRLVQALGSYQSWEAARCVFQAPGPGARVGVIWLHAPGMLLVLAEPQIEFEMSNPEPSCLCCEREACWQVFSTTPPLDYRKGLGRQLQTSPRGNGQASFSCSDGRGTWLTPSQEGKVISMKHPQKRKFRHRK